MPKNEQLIKEIDLHANGEYTKYFTNLLFKPNFATKIITTRHPLDRILSFWHDKLTTWNGTTPFVKLHNKQSTALATNWKRKIERYETATTLKNLRQNEFFSFDAFAKYVANGSGGSPNDHWVSMTHQCNPCLIDYDFIVKLETVQMDAPNIINYLDINKVGRFPITRFDVNGDTKSIQYDVMGKLKNAYKNIDNETILKLFKIYKWDFLLFGYDVRSFLNE